VSWTIRDEDAGENLELLLVISVTTILVIRAFLALTGYPQIGSGGLHIAHMLWGGLFMVVSTAMLLLYWNPAVRRTAAFLGGVGFGTFIDELGKFITSDNDYFFQPTIALLYVMFLSGFLLLRAYFSRRPITSEEQEANRALRLTLNRDGLGRSRSGAVYEAARHRFSMGYGKLAGHRLFRGVLVTLFVVLGIVDVLAVLGLTNWGRRDDMGGIENLSSAASMILSWIGIYKLFRSTRLQAYLWFQRSVLVSVLVTQVFVFYHDELAAIGGLFIHLSLYFILSILIREEQRAGGETPA